MQLRCSAQQQAPPSFNLAHMDMPHLLCPLLGAAALHLKNNPYIDYDFEVQPHRHRPYPYFRFDFKFPGFNKMLLVVKSIPPLKKYPFLN
jgi:hypothetical protein